MVVFGALCIYLRPAYMLDREIKSLSHIPITLVSPPNTCPPSRTAKLTAPPLHQHMYCSTNPPSSPNQPTNLPPQKTTKPKNPDHSIPNPQSPTQQSNPQPNSPIPPPSPPKESPKKQSNFPQCNPPRTKFLPLIPLQLLHLHFFSTSNRTI